MKTQDLLKNDVVKLLVAIAVSGGTGFIGGKGEDAISQDGNVEKLIKVVDKAAELETDKEHIYENILPEINEKLKKLDDDQEKLKDRMTIYASNTKDKIHQIELNLQTKVDRK